MGAEEQFILSKAIRVSHALPFHPNALHPYPLTYLPQREDFLFTTLVVEAGCSDMYSDNDLVLISKDDPFVSVGV